MYIWERPDWPDLTWDSAHLAALLGQASREQGRLLGRMQDLGFDLRREAQLNTLTEHVVRSSEIEGEKLDSDQVRSSIARRLGMDVGGLRPAHGETDPPLMARLARLCLVTIQRFHEELPRIGLALAKMQHALTEQNTQRFHSKAAELRRGTTNYNPTLERSPKGCPDAKPWQA